MGWSAMYSSSVQQQARKNVCACVETVWECGMKLRGERSSAIAPPHSRKCQTNQQKTIYMCGRSTSCARLSHNSEELKCLPGKSVLMAGRVNTALLLLYNICLQENPRKFPSSLMVIRREHFHSTRQTQLYWWISNLRQPARINRPGYTTR